MNSLHRLLYFYRYSKLYKNIANNSITCFNQKTRTTNTYSKPLKYDINKDDTITVKNVNKYTNRSCTCGELGIQNLGDNVTLCGWLEYQRMNKFVVLRDGYGQTQLLVKENDFETQKLLSNTPFESILEIKGTVVPRPNKMINKTQPTGEIEVQIDRIKVLNKCNELPFNIREFQKAKESLRMQYRYLDLRFKQMQRNMRYRSKLLMKMREFLISNSFVDVETPTLFKATPGGAQEFVVPTRFPGQFYSLVQSPQQFKQMLMAGAIDRYFQIARCYRDEGARPDRQPEFTQLDIEMSFTNLDGVIKMIEEMLQFCLNNEVGKIERISFTDAMEYYGCDKPDVSFDFKLQNCTDTLKKNLDLVTHENFGAYCLVFPEHYSNFNKQVKNRIETLSSKFTEAKVIGTIIKTHDEFINKVGKTLSNSVALEFLNKNEVVDKSLIFLCYGNKDQVLNLLGRIRLEYANFLESISIIIRKPGLHFLWIVDFPLFEISQGHLKSAHHPFTAPHPEDIHLLHSDPLKVRGLSYDLVLNGYEVGGGSIRIHDSVLQKTILDLLNIKSDTMHHMLEMLGSGCPPHGGIALGLDRLLTVLLGTTSIRDVIAFPKTVEGRDPISGAPSFISEEDKKMYHIKSIMNENELK